MTKYTFADKPNYEEASKFHPCKECLCVPICHHKPILQALEECVLFRDWVQNYDIVNSIYFSTYLIKSFWDEQFEYLSQEDFKK